MIRVGTRGSALALAQARWVAERMGDEVELVVIESSADAGANDKSRWVSALERALLEERIELAVHSAKDVPAELPEGLELVAIPPREDPRDAICGADSLAALPSGARIGTSSVRRAAQLRSLRDDIEVVPIRGNVDTRLRKLAEGQVDALVLALAGLRRLGREPDAVLDELLPAAAQGALAVEARVGTDVSGQLRDSEATACVLAERDLTRGLGASCDTPVGALARVLEGDQLELRAWVGLPDGSAWVSDQMTGQSNRIGAEVATRLRAAGADELLRAAVA